MNSPFSYGYDTDASNVFTHLSFPIGIDKEEATGIVNEALGTLKLDKTDDGYEMSINGTTVGNIAIPDDRFLSAINYDAANKKLLFTIKGSDEPVEVDVTPFINEYQGGENVTVEGNIINVKLDDYVTDEALKSLLGDYAKAADLEKLYDNRETEAVDSIAEVVEYTEMLKTQVDSMPAVIDEKIEAAKITKVSELDNDMNFTTAEDVNMNINEYVKDFITRDESNADIQEAVSSCATKEELQDYEGRLVDFATKEEISDFVEKGEISDLPTKEEVEQSIGAAIEPLATKEEIKDFVSTEGMNTAIATATEGMATETYVNDAIGNIEIPETPDLTPYATTEAMDTALEGKQDKGNYISYVDENGRKVVTLNNADFFGAMANTEELENKFPAEGWIGLIQLNKWNVVDLGSPRALTNINTPDGVRPTIQERSQSGPEAHQMAYLDDFANYNTKEEVETIVNEAIAGIPAPEEVDLSGYMTISAAEAAHQQMSSSIDAKIVALQNQVMALMTNSVDVVEAESIPATYNDVTKSVVASNKPLNGTVVEVPETFTKPVAANTKIVAKDVTFDGIQATEGDYNQVVSIKADSVSITDSAMNIDGNVVNYNASTGKASNINSPLTVNDASNIFINGLNFNAQNGYNGIEIGLSDTEPKVKNITIENFDIDGRMTHNLFSLYAFADNAVVNISNCHFTDAYGILRISNKFNNTGLVVNITNCTVDKTTCTNGAPNMFLCQDYASTTSDQFFADNQFGNGKITLNITNLMYDGQKVTKDMNVGVPVNGQLNILSVYCGKVDSKHISREEYPEYYPVVNIF